jgi:hypothetical protein
MRRILVSAVMLAGALALTAAAAGHDFDHPAPPVNPPTAPGGTVLSAPLGAWEHVATIPTGNPHTDIDFFEKGGETYMSAGTLAIGPYGGGQTIIKLTQGGEVPSIPLPGGPPMVVSQHPSASCVSDPNAALSLQHDVEATPKGDVIFSTFNAAADRSDAQLLVDATDAGGRCHDQGTLGASGNPRGGLEIIDVTAVNEPVEIGLISHIGHAHTTNVDPKRPHIAFDVTSDTVGVTCNTADTSCTRSNGLNLDGFEVVDLSSCMNFEPLTTVDVKRMLCRPQVYRYRYESALIALGHSVDALSGCHELEIYPDDRLTCASINASILFDLSGAFDDRGTPDDYTDDKPRGTPLPCVVRDSRTMGTFATAAKVTDCVDRNPAAAGNDLDLANYTAPSLEGVVHVGTAFHQGRGGANDSTQDVDVSHEAELSGSGRLLLVTDERGGGVSPPGATCVTSPGDVPSGNGGIHAYRVDSLLATTPSGSDNVAARTQAWTSYAQKPGGGKAIYRAPINTEPQATLCTSHVFHQIPGQNRIFMGWYTQGTQVVDFVEHEDGTVEFKQVGYFIPPKANTWTSAVFKMRRNGDGTFTYWGATGDFNLGETGRSAVDIWKVTLPAPPRPRGVDLPSGDSAAGGGWLLDDSGQKLNFGFTAEDTGEAIEGDLQLNDRTAGVKIHIDEITSIGEVEESCGDIAAGVNALEFRGTGRFNGAGGNEFRVCVVDGGEPNKQVDRFHLECEAGCSYETDRPGRDDVTDGGNIQVNKADASAGGSPQATTVILDPVLASSATPGQAQVFTVRVFDQRNQPLSGANISLTQASAGGVLPTLTGVTGAGGVATFLATPSLGTSEFVASAGGVQSNAIQLTAGT